jgi:hypothetical protein
MAKRDIKKTNLAELLSIKKLGGTLDDAITLQMASMEKEDIETVIAEFEKDK